MKFLYEQFYREYQEQPEYISTYTVEFETLQDKTKVISNVNQQMMGESRSNQNMCLLNCSKP